MLILKKITRQHFENDFIKITVPKFIYIVQPPYNTHISKKHPSIIPTSVTGLTIISHENLRIEIHNYNITGLMLFFLIILCKACHCSFCQR